MPIFNSLGSNYNFSFVLRTLFASSGQLHEENLQKFLEEKYQGSATLVYKGREALRLALRASNFKGATVAICGYTCFAVYDAVVKEGYAVEYLDIEKNTLQFSFETVKKQIEKKSKIKILVIQNTLGFPCDIEKIARYCKEKNIILIEDLAHSIGTIYEDGREAGTVGDFTILSFSQDKMIDGISGGALILRNKNFQFPISNFQLLDKRKQTIDRLYPLFTFLIRKTYMSGLGKVIHTLLKAFKLLSNPMSDSKHIYSLPSWYCSLIYQEFKNLENNLSHRRKIASIYVSSLRVRQKNLVSFNNDIIKQSTNLRFPILVEQREQLISFLKSNNIFVSDIWYDSPVAPKKYFHLAKYDHQCPNSEQISEQMLNLPTNRNVSEKDAEHVADTINQWLKKDDNN